MGIQLQTIQRESSNLNQYFYLPNKNLSEEKKLLENHKTKFYFNVKLKIPK